MTKRVEGGGRAEPAEHMAAPAAPSYAELQRAKTAAEAANEAKTRYLASVSHEMRSPLNAIYGYAQLLERAAGVSSSEAGAVIRRSAEHLTNLVEGLLEISRIESGVIKLQSNAFEIRPLLDQVVRMLGVQAEAKGLYLRLDVSERLPKCVKGDEKRLRQVLINLISNAVKYTRSGGVTVKIGYRSQIADVEIVDTGIGIGAEDFERIFEPFERGSSPEVQQQQGIGLGLAITRVLVQVMGGDLTATSVLGAGSAFRLRLMLAEPAIAPVGVSDDQPIAGYDGARRTVLIIDDNPAQIAVLQAFLRPLGFVVYAASNGADGVALAAHCAPDIILLDIQMPGLNGWQTAEQLRARHGGGPKIVMVSANVHEMRAGGDGASSHDAFLSKPVDLDELLATIGSRLRLRWTVGNARLAPDDAPEPAPLPMDALPLLERLRLSARIGHVRAIQDGLDAFRDAVPAAGGLVAILERQLADFDLRSFLKTLDDAQR